MSANQLIWGVIFNCQFVRFADGSVSCMKPSNIPLSLSVEAVIAASPDAVVVHDLENVVLQWSPVAERIYGWSQDEIVGERITEVFYIDNQSRLLAMNQLLETGSWEGELEQVDASGKGHRLLIRQTLLCDDKGEPAAIISFNSDSSQSLEREVTAEQVQEPSSNDMPLSHLAHELNNVLAPIMLSSAILERRLDDQKSKNMARMIDECARKGTKIVAQMATREEFQGGV